MSRRRRVLLASTVAIAAALGIVLLRPRPVDDGPRHPSTSVARRAPPAVAPDAQALPDPADLRDPADLDDWSRPTVAAALAACRDLRPDEAHALVDALSGTATQPTVDFEVGPDLTLTARCVPRWPSARPWCACVDRELARSPARLDPQYQGSYDGFILGGQVFGNTFADRIDAFQQWRSGARPLPW